MSNKFKAKESVLIHANPQKVWSYISQIEKFENSARGHGPVTILSGDKTLHKGLRWRETEYIGGTTSIAEGEICEIKEGKRYRWEGVATYSYLGVKITIQQGGTFSLEVEDGGTILSHHVWSKFPDTFRGRIIQWIATHLLRMPKKATRYLRAQLEDLKKNIEAEH